MFVYLLGDFVRFHFRPLLSKGQDVLFLGIYYKRQVMIRRQSARPGLADNLAWLSSRPREYGAVPVERP